MRYDIAVRRVVRGILVHAADQHLLAGLLVNPQLFEDVLQPGNDRPVVLVLRFLSRDGRALGRSDRHSLMMTVMLMSRTQIRRKHRVRVLHRWLRGTG